MRIINEQPEERGLRMKTMLGGFAMLLLGVEEDQRNQVLAEIGGERRRERVERKALDGGSRSKFDFPYECGAAP